jgi:hypothetical protein
MTTSKRGTKRQSLDMHPIAIGNGYTPIKWLSPIVIPFVVDFLDTDTTIAFTSPLSKAWRRELGQVSPHLWRAVLGNRVLHLNPHIQRIPTILRKYIHDIEHTTKDTVSILTFVRLRQFTEMHTLCLSGCYSVTDDALGWLTNLNLISLDIGGCDRVTDHGLGHLSHMRLKYLNIRQCHDVTDYGIAKLKRMPLGTLYMHWCRKITDKAFKHMENMPLTSLDVSECRNINFPTEVLDELANLPLRRLDLSFCDVTDDILAELVTRLPGLTQLALSGCSGITDEGIAHLKTLQQLTSLDVSGCRNITDTALGHLSSMPLENLNITRCYHITDYGIEELKRLPLQTIAMKGCYRITENTCKQMQHMPLTALDVSLCAGITAKAIGHLAPLPLKSLIVSPRGFVDEIVEQIGTCLPQLEHLVITQCDISGHALAYLTSLPLTSFRLSRYDYTNTRQLI